MKVAVIGGGLFGCTAAIYAKRAGHEVHLFEAGPEIMLGATAGSYNRLHRGYHYPRSPETGRECLNAEASFRREYGQAVLDGGRQLYAVAEGGLVDAGDFALFMNEMGLEFSKQGSELTKADWLFCVNEPRIDPWTLVNLVQDKLSGVHVHLNTPMPDDVREQFDAIVVAAYAGMNSVLRKLCLMSEPYKFQVVEKPVIRMPEEFKDTSIVVLDGPFCCLDPHGQSEMHVIGHVTETVHAENVGTHAEVPDHLKEYLDRGVVTNFPHTRIKRVLEESARFIPAVAKAEYIGSALTIRAVLPDQEKTDARPTLVQRLDHRVVRVFSGKMGTAVIAARDVVENLRTIEQLKQVAA